MVKNGITCFIDFETRSTANLKKVGAHVYSQHITTDALCLAYAFSTGPVQLWKYGEPLPNILRLAVANEAVTFAAHNATFEFLIWNFCCVKRYGWPSIPLHRFDCTMVRAFAMGLPGKLEMAARAVGMKHEKDMKGHRIMLQLCKPRKVDAKTGVFTWWEIDDEDTGGIDVRAKYESLYKYCKQDVIVERELDKRILPLSKKEKRLWLLDQKINFRGVHLDVVAAKKAMYIVSKEQDKFNLSINVMTDGDVNTVNSHAALKKWVNANGVKTDLCDKPSVVALLEKPDLPKKVRNVLLLRQEASKSSTAKIKAMIVSKSADSRVRGCLQFNGAASTGRWAGRRIQLQNLKRPDLSQSDIEFIMERLNKAPAEEVRDYLSIFHSSAIKPLADCIRAMLVSAPGKTLISADWAAVEGRMLAWLAGEEKVLNIYRSHGKIYEHNACGIFNIFNIDEVTKAQRLVGKVSELALGFQGGVGALQSMATQHFLTLTDTQANDIKLKWRQNRPATVKYWYALENAAFSAVANPGKQFKAGPIGREITYLMNGSFLFCRLPSGRPICYPYPKIKKVMTPWGEPKNAVTYKGLLYGKFVKRVAYGGLLAENATQAAACCLLREALVRVEEAGYPIVMHVHDEIVTETTKKYGSVQGLVDLMCVVPSWAKDLPLKASGWWGHRYRK